MCLENFLVLQCGLTLEKSIQKHCSMSKGNLKLYMALPYSTSLQEHRRYVSRLPEKKREGKLFMENFEAFGLRFNNLNEEEKQLEFFGTVFVVFVFLCCVSVVHISSTQLFFSFLRNILTCFSFFCIRKLKTKNRILFELNLVVQQSALQVWLKRRLDNGQKLNSLVFRFFSPLQSR